MLKIGTHPYSDALPGGGRLLASPALRGAEMAVALHPGAGSAEL